jgi:hypothetical protein
MSNALSSVFMSGLTIGLNVAALRALPIVFVFHASARKRTHAIGVLASFACLVFLAVRFASFDAIRTLTAYGYLSVMSVGMYFAGRHGTRFYKFSLSWFIFLIAPTLLWPNNWLITLLGWDLAMSCFSYCVEVAPAQFDLREYMFFMLVNPTVAYPARGTRVAEPGFQAQAALRSARGAAGLMLSGSVTAVAARWLPTTDGAFALLARLVSLFLAHTSLAALQIGLMGQLGYLVPERYRGLWSVRTPAQFWARWNSYIATWARLYIFVPCVRSSTGLSHAQKNALAVLATFASIGALHDLYAFAQSRELSTAMLQWFAANGALVVIWQWCARRFRANARPARQLARVLVFASCVGVLAASLP